MCRPVKKKAVNYFHRFAVKNLATKAQRHDPARGQDKKCIAFFFCALVALWLNSIFLKIVYLFENTCQKEASRDREAVYQN